MVLKIRALGVDQRIDSIGKKTKMKKNRNSIFIQLRTTIDRMWTYTLLVNTIKKANTSNLYFYTIL